jgi:uncharacterized damage-inducible protein DinB
MSVLDLKRLYDYGRWANAKLLAVVLRLTPEQFTQDVAGSYGSVRNTLVHAMSAQWGWLDRCGGTKRGAALKGEDYPTPESLIVAWDKVDGYSREFLARLSDEDVERKVEFEFPPGEPHALALGALMQHAAIHAVHHRGQAALLLRELGQAPENFDLLFYDAARETPAAG